MILQDNESAHERFSALLGRTKTTVNFGKRGVTAVIR